MNHSFILLIILQKTANLNQIEKTLKSLNNGKMVSIFKGRSLIDSSFSNRNFFFSKIVPKKIKNLSIEMNYNEDVFSNEDWLFFIHSLFQNDLVSGSILVDIFRKFKNAAISLCSRLNQSPTKTIELFLFYKGIESETLPTLLFYFFQTPFFFVLEHPLGLILKSILKSKKEFTFFLKFLYQKSKTKNSFSKIFKEEKGLLWEIIINTTNKKYTFFGQRIIYQIESSVLGNLLNISPATLRDLFLKSSFLLFLLPNLLKFYINSSPFKRKNTLKFMINTFPFRAPSLKDLIILLQSVEISEKKKLIIGLSKKIEINRWSGFTNFFSKHPLIGRIEKKLKILSFW